MVARIKAREHTVKIGLVGKYVQLHDAYLSVAEALRHAGFALGAEVDIQWIDSETLNEGRRCTTMLSQAGRDNRARAASASAASTA